MTKTRSTKRALLMSALSLLLCVSMLIGTTYAWFTDSVTSTGNKIVAGTLDVDFLMADASGNYTSIAEKAGAIFGGEDSLFAQNVSTNTLWEPGKTQIAYLAVENKGSLDLKYNILLDVIDGGLVGALEYAVVDGAQYGSLPAGSNWETVKALAQVGDIAAGSFVAAPNGQIKADEDFEYFALAVHMKEEAGNEYQGKDITIDLAVVATQLASEEDSFGKDYDAEATYPHADGNLSQGGVLTAGEVSVTLPTGTVKEYYTLKVDNERAITDDAGQTTVYLNIDLLKNGVKVEPVAGTSYKVEINAGKNLEIVSVKHKGEDIPEAERDYDPNTGIITFYMSSFSPFEYSYKTLAAKVGNTTYYTIDDAIANWTNGTTLTLLSDVTLSDVIKLSSTEYHVLDLGTYTMTAASGKDAIQYVVNGRSSASYALDIKADAENPGGITAKGKAIVSHIKPKSGAPGKDRPITRFYGGIFNASYIVKQGGNGLFMPGAGYTGANAPYFYFYGGEYNGTIYTNRSQNQFHGGTFNGSMMMSVDTSSYTLVTGGKFKNLSNSMRSDLSEKIAQAQYKFTIGSLKAVYDRDVYMDDDGYMVIAKTKPEQEIEAAVAITPDVMFDYLAYSKVATEGKLGYTDVYTALAKDNSATVTVYVDTLDMEGISFTGTIVVPEGNSLTINNAPDGLKVEGNAVLR